MLSIEETNLCVVKIFLFLFSYSVTPSRHFTRFMDSVERTSLRAEGRLRWEGKSSSWNQSI